MMHSLDFRKNGQEAVMALVAVLLLLSSCTGRNEDVPRCLIEKSGIVNIDETRLSNIVNVKRLVQLESGEDYMVGDITKLIKKEGLYFVESGRNSLFVFDSLGHFQNDIGEVGGAENEYIGISDFDVCKDCVYVLSPMKIQLFSIKGEYLRTIPMKFSAASALKVLDDKIVLYVLGDENLIHVIDMEGKEKSVGGGKYRGDGGDECHHIPHFRRQDADTYLLQ